MFENEFCEYAVVKKIEGAYLAKIILCTILLIGICVASFLFVIPSSLAVGALLIAAAGIAAWYLSRFTAIEYEYSLSGEYMDFAAIYSKQYRREKLSVELKKEAKKVFPFDGNFDGFNVEKVLDLRSSSNVKNAYVMVYESNEHICAVVFDATKKIVEHMFHQIPSLVVRADTLPE